LEVSVEQVREIAGVEPTDPGESPTERLERNERQAQLHEALKCLSEEHRDILVLREMEGHAYESISEMLDLPVGTVRSRLHRARTQLRDQLVEILREPTEPRQEPRLGQESK
jgi:RNA polymerase sigma-70 factor (ECF subfamily)